MAKRPPFEAIHRHGFVRVVAAMAEYGWRASGDLVIWMDHDSGKDLHHTGPAGGNRVYAIQRFCRHETNGRFRIGESLRECGHDDLLFFGVIPKG